MLVPGLQHFVKSLNGVIPRILQYWTKWYGLAQGSLLIARPAAALPAPAARLAAAHAAAHGGRSAEPCSRARPGTQCAAVGAPAPSSVPAAPRPAHAPRTRAQRRTDRSRGQR